MCPETPGKKPQYGIDLQDVERIARRFVSSLRGSPRQLVTYLAHGLIVLIPLVVTIWALVWVFNLVDGLLAPILNWGFGHPVPGLGFAIMLTIVILVGWFGVRFGRRRMFDFLERNLTRIPIAGTIYGGTKQILESFTTTSSSRFLEVVFMEFPRKGIYTIGLVTSEATDKNGKTLLNVYIPTAPNPTSGFLQIVPESDVVRSAMPIEDAMKLIISAGKVSHKDIANMILEVSLPESKGQFPEHITLPKDQKPPTE